MLKDVVAKFVGMARSEMTEDPLDETLDLGAKDADRSSCSNCLAFLFGSEANEIADEADAADAPRWPSS